MSDKIRAPDDAPPPAEMAAYGCSSCGWATGNWKDLLWCEESSRWLCLGCHPADMPWASHETYQAYQERLGEV